MPKGWYIAEYQNTHREFHIRIRVGHNTASYTLFIIKVTADQTVILKRNFVNRIIRIFENPEGIRREVRLFEALSILTQSTPQWFRKAERAVTSLDKRGIDGFVRINIGDRKLRVALQVKSSEGGRRIFYEEHPDRRSLIPVVIVNDDDDNERLREKTYRAIATIRKQIIDGELTISDYKRRLTKYIRGAAK